MIDWTETELERYLKDDPSGVVVMLNLLRFVPDGGRDRYFEYVAHLAPLHGEYGLELLYVGDGGAPLVAADEGDTWDMVAVVRYPSRAAFVAMVRSDEYQAGEHLRREALTDSVLQPTVPLGS